MRQHSVTSRVSALGILSIVLVVIWFGLAAPLLSAFVGSVDDEREKSLNLLARYDAVIAQKGSLDTQLKVLGTTSEDQSGLIAGNTPAVAAAALQGELKALIETFGGEIRSAQIMPPEKVEDFEKIAIQYELSLPPASLQRLLHGLETHRTVLVLDSLRLRVPETMRATDASGVEARISSQWTIAGFRRVELNAR